MCLVRQGYKQFFGILKLILFTKNIQSRINKSA